MNVSGLGLKERNSEVTGAGSHEVSVVPTSGMKVGDRPVAISQPLWVGIEIFVR
jgi:hypothetical protein